MMAPELRTRFPEHRLDDEVNSRASKVSEQVRRSKEGDSAMRVDEMTDAKSWRREGRGTSVLDSLIFHF